MAIGLGRVVASWMVAAGVIATLSSAPRASAGGAPLLPDHGFQWSTVTHVGNDPITLMSGGVFPVPIPIGRVNHNYRIMTTEVTIGQWFEFVQAYAPFIQGNEANTAFTGTNGIFFNGFVNGVPTYVLNTTIKNQPVHAGWRYGARLANWLHAGKPGAGVATAADFEQGAYDTSTFATLPHPNGSGSYITDQTARSQGARFFFPTYDEWVKAAFFDPNRYGPDQPGYWDYPITSDTAPIPDSPQFGGQTNTGTFPAGHPRPLDVGSYPDAQSPWGVLDLSGGGTEWLETINNFYNLQPGALPRGRLTLGSQRGVPASPALTDLIRGPSGAGSSPDTEWAIRLASLVPSPSVPLAVCLPAFTIAFRRRR